MAGIRHSSVPTVPDDGVSPVGTNEWNADHTIADVVASGVATIAGLVTGLRYRTSKQATPANPPANALDVYYATAGPGVATPAALMAIDENGVLARLAGFAILDYRLLGIRVLTAGTSYVPTNGTRAIFVECIGAGGQGGGAATSSSTCSLGSGGGGGYSAKWLTGAAVKNPTAYVVGAAGSGAGAGAAGNPATDTTWDTNVIVAKGGLGGLVLAAGSTNVASLGPAAAVAGTGVIGIPGNLGDFCYRISGTVIGWSGAGAVGPKGGAGGQRALATLSVGLAAPAGSYGAGGGGAATLSTGQAGGAGQPGVIIVWEFA